MHAADPGPRSDKRRSLPSYRDLSAELRAAAVTHSDEAGADDVRRRIVQALATLRPEQATQAQAQRIERQQAIVLRCELGGQLHKVVAAELGISMRTFYRERAEAFARLRDALAAMPVTAATVRVRSDGIAFRIQRAWEQVSLGRFREAIVALEEIAASAPPATLAVACARLASVRVLAFAEHRSAEALTRAKRALALLGPGPASVVAEAEILAAEAFGEACEGRFERALRTYEHVRDDLRARVPSEVDTARLVTIGSIDAHLARGDAAAALAIATEMGEPIVAAAVSESALIAGHDPQAVLEMALEAQAAAAASGRLRHSASALIVAAQASAATFDTGATRAFLRAALKVVQELPVGHRETEVLLELAGAFAECRDGETALMLVRRCARPNERAGEDFLAGVVLLREADAYSALGRHRDAVIRARHALRVLSSFDSRRFTGEAFLSLAAALRATGEGRSGRFAAMRAARLLHGASWPARVARAQRLTGRRLSLPGDTAVPQNDSERAG